MKFSATQYCTRIVPYKKFFGCMTTLCPKINRSREHRLTHISKNTLKHCKVLVQTHVWNIYYVSNEIFRDLLFQFFRRQANSKKVGYWLEIYHNSKKFGRETFQSTATQHRKTNGTKEIGRLKKGFHCQNEL